MRALLGALLLLAALPSAAGAGTLDAGIAPEGTAARFGVVLRPDPARSMDVAAAPLVVETAPEVAFGRDPGLPVCEREQLEAAVGNCPAGSQVGAGALDLATPRGARTVTVDVFAAPGGRALALAATGDGGRRSVVAEAGGSRLSIPWTDLVAAGGGGGVVAFTLRIDAASGWATTTGCSSGSWSVRATMSGDAAEDAVACSAGPTGPPPGGGLCGPVQEGVRCIEGGGRRSQGGGEKVSHAGWPAITGVVAIADASGRAIRGTALNDELLGHHGSDTLAGGDGSDVIWGDHLAKGNGPRQRDRLDGGAADDFLYASHGRNVLLGGAGDDVLWAYFVHGVNRVAGGAGDDVIWERSGRGTIDCGPGRDLVHARLRTPYRLRGCEGIDYYRGRAGPR